MIIVNNLNQKPFNKIAKVKNKEVTQDYWINEEDFIALKRKNSDEDYLYLYNHNNEGDNFIHEFGLPPERKLHELVRVKENDKVSITWPNGTTSVKNIHLNLQQYEEDRDNGYGKWWKVPVKIYSAYVNYSYRGIKHKWFFSGKYNAHNLNIMKVEIENGKK